MSPLPEVQKAPFKPDPKATLVEGKCLAQVEPHQHQDGFEMTEMPEGCEVPVMPKEKVETV